MKTPAEPDPEAAFGKVVAAFVRDSRVEPPATTRRAFGSNGLKVDGRIFAMLVRGALVVKLPRPRVEELVQTGRGTPFVTGGGRVMKEWVMLEEVTDSWLALAREARTFVGAATKKRP